MASLFTALGTAGNSLDAIEQAIGVVQNNVTNATTPGYVTQTLQLGARPFDPSANLWGGVEVTGVQDSRDVYAEQSVWSANEQSGYSSQQSASLNQLQQIFNVSGQSGIPGALSNLYSAFSAWSTSPSNATEQQAVITAAQGLSTAVTQTYAQAQQINSDTQQQLSASVSQLNQYTSQIATINGEIRTSPTGDAGLQAQLYNTIEQVSNLAPVTVNIESDGTATVLLDGQSPLVQGRTQNNVSVNYVQPGSGNNSGPSPTVQLLSSDGQDITALANQGTIGGAINFCNSVIPGVLGVTKPTPTGLNGLANGIATVVNNLLTAGQVSAGPPSVAGVPLFSAQGSTPGSSFSVVASMTGSQLAAISPGPPAVANGVAQALAGLATPTNAASMVNGFSLTEFYGNIASSVGQQASTASDDVSSNTSLLNQAQSLRAQVSGVSLNDQATKLLQFQESYQASAQMISTINTMTQSLLTVMQQVT
jgi:flagellar hook-associated protein 1 FlgK